MELQKKDILDLSKQDMEEWLKKLSEPAYRAKQIFGWLHFKHASKFDEMTDVPNKLRVCLEKSFYIGGISIEKKLRSSDGTLKYLFSLKDLNCIESAVMFYNHGISVCISTQVGCRMGCVFCASTGSGLIRNLTVSEMLQQVYAIAEDINDRVNSVVLMGIGEPLDNFCNVARFYDMITDKDAYALSNRSVSLSTCGLADDIDKLADLNKQLTLSVSLHAATDKKRDALMPVNKTYGISRLMKSSIEYQQKTGRRVSFEYAVMAGYNDTKEDAVQLSKLLNNMKTHVNLIPVNAAGTQDYKASVSDAETFRNMLQNLGVNATVRRTLGADINAACGQLRKNVLTKPET